MGYTAKGKELNDIGYSVYILGKCSFCVLCAVFYIQMSSNDSVQALKIHFSQTLDDGQL